jgi:predicted MFS family arabinose efflux permease
MARVLLDRELLRLNVGIFSLHAVLMGTFVVVPLALKQAGVEAAHQWIVYLGALVAGVLLMLPGVVGRAASHEKTVFLTAIATVAVSLAVLALGLGHLAGIVTGLVIFFAGFNVLEAKLPALVSKAAPREARGTATGLYSSVQFLGTFVGGAVGGTLAQHVGAMAVLLTGLAAMAVWFAVALGMGEYAALSARR